MNTARVLHTVLPKKKAGRPSNFIRGICFDICGNWIFKIFVSCSIIAQCGLFYIIFIYIRNLVFLVSCPCAGYIWAIEQFHE